MLTIPTAALAAAGTFGITQLSSHAAAAALLAILGAALATALLIGLRRTARGRQFEPDRIEPGRVPAPS